MNDLFDAEEKALADARRLREHLEEVADPELRRGVGALVKAFERSLREQRRLVRFSDRLQGQLANLNQELQRRRQEAEDALARLEETQETLVQQEKLASLGALVAGVAHEINTPVGIALSCASHLADATERLKDDFASGSLSRSEFSRYLATAEDTSGLILANCDRAAQLIRSFKQVATDRTSSERRQFDLRDYVEEVLFSLAPRLRQLGHQVSIDCPSGLTMDSYPGALAQVLTNLVMNSILHAYDEGQTGQFSITVTQPDADSLRLVFADDGKGIPTEHLPRIFDPFFTTRRGNGGSGLGLHIVYNLVTGPLGGSLGVDSAPGKGSSFTLLLPRVVRERENDTVEAEQEA
ncbi:sensor histidine kinase [Telmatospirillum sp. J64-1]|uniref:sensor histidine kinase n=1 Tax=Telmatospirillum sp. J64-1 TaxID=2502183 RepID=UPI00115F0795|nr:HAMP domain-containing sensor histidine kinase [Telmatospirillum sp. J64-1]